MTVHIQKTRYNTGDQTNRISLTSVKYSMRINEVSESRIKYHGTQGGIDVKRLHTPMWFTGSKQDAMHYAGDDGQIVVAKLLCNRPYVIDPVRGDEPNMVLDRWQELIKQGYDSIHDPRVDDWVPFYSKDIRVLNVINL